MLKKTSIFVLASLVIGVIAGLPVDSSGRQTTIRITGSSTVLPVVARAAEHFAARDSELRITVNSTGSGVGIRSVAQHLVEIGMVSRDILDSEKSRFPKVNFQVYVIGRDAVACVVSSEIYEAGVTVLTKGELQKIYRGELTNWNEVGGPDRPIVAIDKETSRGTRQVFMAYLFGTPGAKAPGASLVTGSNNEGHTKIALSDSAIGMLSLAWIDKDVIGVAIHDTGTVVAPSLESIRKGTYPIVRDLTVVTDGPATGATKAFIDFLHGPEGQRIVEEMGYVPNF